MRILLFVLLMTTSLEAQIRAEQVNKNTTVIFLNACPDLDPNDVFRSNMTREEYEALTLRWDCLNRYQSAQSPETLSQIKTAIKNTHYKKPITIYSVDPRTSPKNCNPDLYIGDCEWNFGAWKKNGRLEFAAMPGCPNARWELGKLLRRLR
jgi:hypothetical protein